VFSPAGAGSAILTLHIWEGGFDLGRERRLDYRGAMTLPRTLGHEIAGEVAACGPEAGGIEIGARRVVYPWIGCGTCRRCQAGAEHLCSAPRMIGIRADVLVPHPRYLSDIGELAPDFACTLACSGLTAYSALKKVLPGAERLMILGAGGVGLAAISLAAGVFGTRPSSRRSTAANGMPPGRRGPLR